MRLRRISSGLVALFALLTARQTQAAAPETAPSGVLSFFRELQGLEWDTVDEDKVASLLHGRLEAESLDIANTCEGRILYAAELKDTRIVVEFRQERLNNRCRRRLTHATAVIHLSNNEAHLLEAEVRRAVKAGGRPCDVDRTDKYEWRSRDSLKRYILHTDIAAESEGVSPATPARLRISLEHFSTTAADVDDLPFERGFVAYCP